MARPEHKRKSAHSDAQKNSHSNSHVKSHTHARTSFIVGSIIFGILFLVGFFLIVNYGLHDAVVYSRNGIIHKPKVAAPPPTLDKADYDGRMIALANYPAKKVATSTSATSTQNASEIMASSTRAWPVKNIPYPKVGAILPFKRVIAYYGNFYSKGMGVLGQYPEGVMLEKLNVEVAKWEAADPTTPVVPAIHYIVQTAQELPQKDGTYRLQMPDSQIDKAIEIANKIHGIVFIDFQVGLSTLQRDLPDYEKYLSMPNVHLGIDPEFSMKTGAKPGREIGEFDAADINYAAQYLASLVKAHDLPPKILVIHRFTQDMVTGYRKITPLSEVQIVMDMDGWGDKAKKLNTYARVVVSEPVQFTGFKLFYKNDLLPPSTGLLTPAELLKLTPRPIYIQYQ